MSGRNGRKRHAAQPILGSTKGKLLVSLCRKRQIVTELADHLKLTDNAVRAQLQRLERDGLVVKAGSRRGVRRPHVEYELTNEARKLFPIAYEPVLVKVVDVLTDRLPAKASRGLLLEAARRLLRQRLGDVRGRGARQRLTDGLNRLNGSGLGIEVSEEAGGKTVIRACSCPIAAVTAVHPEMCGLFATLLSELLDVDVAESCERGESARCCFELTVK
jgi:predicted ArsR family transcriptional regulator